MRIGIFTEAYRPIISGVVTVTQTLFHQLQRKGHSTCLFAPSFPGYKDQEPNVYRFPSVKFPISSWIPITIPFAPKALLQVAQAELDIFHTQHPFLIGRSAKAIARLQKAPLICTVHTQYEHYVHYATPWSPRLGQAIAKVLIRRFCNQCDAVITPALGMKKILLSYGIHHPIHVIPNPIDLTPYLSTEGAKIRQSLGLEKAFVLLYVGRLAPEKNLDFLLRVMGILHSSFPRARLMIVGDGPSKPALESLRRELGLDQVVLFIGAVKAEETPQYYKSADIFLLPSKTEVNPRVLIEASAAGLPTVALDTFSAREVLPEPEQALLCPEDEEAFAQAILRLLREEDLRREIARKAQERAFSFSAERVTDQVLSLYQHLLSR